MWNLKQKIDTHELIHEQKQIYRHRREAYGTEGVRGREGIN